MIYQNAKRYVTRLLLVFNNLLLLVIVSDLAPFPMYVLLILINGIVIVQVNFDELQYSPMLLIKVFIATNFSKPSGLTREIISNLNKIVEYAPINPDELERTMKLLHIVEHSYQIMIYQAFEQNKNAIINIPDRDASLDELMHIDSKIMVYCVCRNDVAPYIDTIMSSLAMVKEKMAIIGTIKMVYGNQVNSNSQAQTTQIVDK